MRSKKGKEGLSNAGGKSVRWKRRNKWEGGEEGGKRQRVVGEATKKGRKKHGGKGEDKEDDRMKNVR